MVVLNRAKAIEFGDRRVKAESGASFSTLARLSVARGLAGLEWAIGIPGSVGGAVVGNAGGWGGDVASALIQATILEVDGTRADWPVERFAYDYRKSALKGHAPDTLRTPVVLDAGFALDPADKRSLQHRVTRITEQRKARQPAGASCGSVFKNPDDDYAGRLIEAAGLKGHRQGGIQISPMHANFFINHGSATAKDVRALIELARDKVKANSGRELELEIELLGQWPASTD
jgi:UDP-N-acetylmuramate dehydrogenase